MGNCCGSSTVDTTGDIKSGLDNQHLSKRMDARQLSMLIKCQAVIRGFLTRKKLRMSNYNVGIAAMNQNYEMDDQQ